MRTKNDRTKNLQTRMIPGEIRLFHSLCRASETTASRKLRELARGWMAYQLEQGVEHEPVVGDLRTQRLKGIELV